MLRPALRLVGTAVLWLLSVVAIANQCDCQQVIGKCTGAIELTKAFGSAPSYGAEIAVYSSEKVCSKVEYFVGSTPYQTLLVNRNKETDNLFGTSPILPESIKYSACFICKNLDVIRGEVDSKRATVAPSPLSGTWSGYTTSLFGRQDAMLNLSVSEGKVAGTYIHPKLGALALYDGTYSNGALQAKCDTQDGPMQWSLQVSGDALQGTWKAGMWSGSAQLTRR